MNFDRPMTPAEALDAGATAWELRTEPWDHPHWGVVSRTAHDDEPMTRIRDVLPIMERGSVLTGWAAAHFQGVMYVNGRDRFYRQQPVLIASPSGGQHRVRAGIQPSRRTIEPWETVVFDGVAVTTIARAAYDLALDAQGLREAIVAIDMCTSTVIKQARSTLSNVRSLIEHHAKTRGIVRARRAVELASTRSASPWESRTRDIAQRRAGIEALKVNVPIFDLQGNLAGIADLLDDASGFVIESDGGGHREELEHADDNVREEGFERLGLFVSRVGSVDHRDERALTDRLTSGRLHARLNQKLRNWTLEKPDWWWRWEPGRRWD